MAERDLDYRSFESFSVPVELGVQNQRFSQKLLQAVITQPDQYYDLRDQVVQQLILTEAQRIYGTLIGFLYNGELPHPNPGDLNYLTMPKEEGDTAAARRNRIRPLIPLAKCKPLALATVKQITELMQSVISEVLPESHMSLANATQARRQEGVTGIKF